MGVRRSTTPTELDKALDEIWEEEERQRANEEWAATVGTQLESVGAEGIRGEEGMRTDAGFAIGALARQLFSDEDHENDADEPEVEDIDGENLEEEQEDGEEEAVKEEDVIEDGAEEAKPLPPEAANGEEPPRGAETAEESGGASERLNASGRAAAAERPRKSRVAGKPKQAVLKRPAGARRFIFDRFRDISYWAYKGNKTHELVSPSTRRG